MDRDPNNWQFPAIVGVTGPGLHIHPVRELTEDEKSKLARYTREATTAWNRFKLFAILKKNYSEWSKYTRSLLKPGDNLDADEMLELDRLLLNFLSSAKSLLDHFRQHWVQVYRNTPEEDEFGNFINKLEDGCWAFAFFQDLRNFTQHCGLPVGNYSRNSSADSVTLKVQADSEWLVDHYNKWEKSKLTKDIGKLDLIALTRDYYVRLHQDFGNFVATAFAPNLIEAHNFFAGMAKQVAEVNPRAQFRLLTGFSQDGNERKFGFSYPPSDLLGSLGIVVRGQPKRIGDAAQDRGSNAQARPAND